MIKPARFTAIKSLVPIAFILTLLTACKNPADEYFFSVGGTVTEYGTSVPLEGVNVIYTRLWEAGDNLMAVTDEQGNFKIRVRINRTDRYKLQFKKAGYFDFEDSYLARNSSEVNSNDISLTEKHKLNLHIINTTKQYEGIKVDGDEYIWGFDTDTTIIKEVNGNITSHFYYELVEKNSYGSKSITQPVNLEANYDNESTLILAY
jgi:hypothetical protein